MNKAMKRTAGIFATVALALTGGWALAQPAPAVAPAATSDAPAPKAEQAQTVPGSGATAPTSSVTKKGAVSGKETMSNMESNAAFTGSKPVDKKAKAPAKASGKETMESMHSGAAFTGSKPVDKNAKAASPQKKIQDMTPEERAKARKEVVEGAKP